jgi:hypothetical protein
MIIQENITANGVSLIKTYSDMYMIRQIETGEIYDEAIDIPGKYTYEETEEYNPDYLESLNNLDNGIS